MEMRYGTKKKKEAKNGKGTKGNGKKEKITYKDVVIMFLAEGLGLVQKLVETGKVSSSAVHRAAEDLKAQFPDRADLLTKYADSVAPADRGRGRVAAKIGDERDYKAQKIGGNEAFIRLPLGVLEVKKGQLITVRFAADRLTACKKAG